MLCSLLLSFAIPISSPSFPPSLLGWVLVGREAAEVEADPSVEVVGVPGSTEKSREHCWDGGRLRLPGVSLCSCCSVVSGGMGHQGLLLLCTNTSLIAAGIPPRPAVSWDSFSS